MPIAKYRDPATGQYVPILGGSGSMFTGAQISSTPPTPRGVGDMWVDTSSNLLEWDTTWKSLTLLNGWVWYGSPFPTPSYRKLPGNLVNVRGLVRNGTAVDIATLPVGYRPTGQLIICAFTDPKNVARINVMTGGELRLEAGTYSAGWVSLDNLTFVAG